MNHSLKFVAVLAFTGCSVLPSPTRPQFDYLVLSSADTARSSTAANASVTLDAVELPNYLDRNEVVTRSSDNQIVFSPRERWAEALAVAVPRMLAHDLDAELAGTYPAATSDDSSSNEFSVEVHIDRFERTTAGNTELRAHWSVHRVGETTKVNDQLRAEDPLTVGKNGANEAAASLSRLLQKLAVAIAADNHRGQTPAAP